MFEDLPVAVAFGLLWLIGTLRAGATYALGRGARGASDRGERVRELLARPGMVRTEAAVQRFGAPAVTLCFLTVGVQTAVNLAAGVLRMPLVHYVPALLLGTAIWATIYVTVGLAVLSAVWGGRPWLLVVAVAVVGVVALAARAVRRRLT
ncbi:VTT domain-containing protein [Nocardioides zeae]|uniref:VTT domain-containing protein n=1 Tax=Nocardioides imazamoxiresistens TaxID=3231893 RepID=A0ABU3PXM0_9ACTN|nr:VTT domain-containing protein [Nocardioides zeae]MDT9593979.1 VTT domain-containing protein [Nocardioides zeae]